MYRRMNRPGIDGGSTPCRRTEHIARPRVYPDEFRERAVKLVREWRDARGVSKGGVTAVPRQLASTGRLCVAV